METTRTREVVLMPAYWHKIRKWVGIPLYYLPSDAIDANGDIIRFKVKYLNEDKNERNEPSPQGKSYVGVPVSMSIVPWMLPLKEVQQICIRNGIHLQWVIGVSPTRSQNESRRVQRKIEPITAKEFGFLIKALGKCNKQTKLIIEILWYLNRSLGKGGGYVTCEELLRLKVQDLEFRKDSPGCVRLIRTGNRTQMVYYVLPTYLWDSLCRQIPNHSFYVFSNKYGGPLLPSQIDIHLRRAGKLVGIKNPITSLSLRPTFDKKKVHKAGYRAKKSYRNIISPRDLEIVSAQTWEKIIAAIPHLSRKRGSRGTHSSRDLLNAILYHLKTGIPWRDLPAIFPPSEAVRSQYRYWNKHGVFKEITHLLEEQQFNHKI